MAEEKPAGRGWEPKNTEKASGRTGESNLDCIGCRILRGRKQDKGWKDSIQVLNKCSKINLERV